MKDEGREGGKNAEGGKKEGGYEEMRDGGRVGGWGWRRQLCYMNNTSITTVHTSITLAAVVTSIAEALS